MERVEEAQRLGILRVVHISNAIIIGEQGTKLLVGRDFTEEKLGQIGETVICFPD